MATSAKSVSPAPSTSEPKGFKGLVAKAKLGRKEAPSTTSLTGSSISDEVSERAGTRNSVDSSRDKVRDSRGSSLDDGLPSGPSSLSKLIPGRMKKKKRRKGEEAEQQLQADPRGRSADGQTATSAVPTALSGNNRSRSALEEDEEEDGESLMTIESDTEPPTVSPPPLISHQSHIGFLTSSSPLINTTTHGDTPSTLQLDPPSFKEPQYQNAATDPVKGSTPSSSANLAPDNAATMASRDGERKLSLRDGSKNRGVSPGARIKDVFTVGSKKKDSSPPKSPDRASVLSSGSGNALQALFSKDKRNSINLGRSSKAYDSKESVVSNLQSPSASVRDIPAIVTTPNTPTSASVDPPETHVTPPTPIDQRQDVPSSPSLATKAAGAAGTNTVASFSGNTIAHRRVRSDSGTLASSRLSNVMSAPLTPMAEEKTPGGRSPSQGSQAGGFFSSVFSAAQNAANQLSSTITNNQTRSRSSTQTIEEDGDEQADGVTAVVAEDAPLDEQKRLAVETLGTGDLSLSHLGIGIDSPLTNNGSATTLPHGLSEKGPEGSTVQREEAAAQAENASAARAVSQAYSLKSTEDNVATPVAEDVAPIVKPRSVYESSIMTGDKTPPNGSMYEGNHGFRRSGSVRSRVGTIAKRHRNSSSATGGTIAAAIAAGNAALANPTASGSTTKPTGFAVASKKRNRDFHQLFRSVPEDDYLIEDYSCALQRDIILAGRIYISEGHICFSSNILGWVTTLIISFEEIVSVEKESTAMVFPNAIAIQTLHARQTFRSLLSREATYDLIIGIWKINHPSLKSSLNGVRLEGGTGDKTEKVDPSGSDEASEVSDEEEEVYDEDDDDEEGTGSFTEVPEASVTGSELAADQQSKAVIRKASAMGVAAGAAAGGVPTPSESKAGEKAAAASAASADFPGPATHAPTECSDGASHYERPLQDDTIPAPLGKVYSMVFGAASGGFMAKWLLDEIKVTDLTMTDDKKGLSEENKCRNYSYIKPLNASIGPKTTKCVVTETLDSFDLEKAISVTQSTQTPDVPSGNVFATKTHFCLMWAPGNSTRLVINFTIEWTGKSWLKGPIEKGANDGQTSYCNDLVKALKAGVTSRPRAGTNGSKLKSKGKRRKGEADPARTSPASVEAVAVGTQPKDSSWGLFEPLRGILGPVVDIFRPMISSNMVIGFLLFIIVINWFRAPRPYASGNSLAYIPTAQKIAAYEEIWRREENDLWDWLEERVGMQGLANPGSSDREAVAQARRKREQSLRNNGLRSKLENMKMSEREVDHAIKVTEQKLAVLKRAVQEKKGVQDEMGSPSEAADETNRPEAEGSNREHQFVIVTLVCRAVLTSSPNLTISLSFHSAQPSIVKMVNFRSCTAIALALLINFLPALTIPLSGLSLYKPLNTALSRIGSPSMLSFPPEPFRYSVAPYYGSQTSIIFTNYGSALVYDDARQTLLDAQVIILREITRHGDEPVGRTRVFGHGSVSLVIVPGPLLNYAYLGLWLAGATQVGEEFGFVECDMRYVDERPIFGPAGFTLGGARLGSSSGAKKAG